MAQQPTDNQRVTEEQIVSLLTPFLGPDRLTTQQLHQVLRHLDLLLRWNSKINLTAVRDAEQIITRHFGESFFAARHLLAHRSSAGSAIDIGTGAGFPGLPMKIWAPSLKLTLIESNNKKVAFLRETVRTVGLLGITVLADRAESLNIKSDLVTLRAVEQFESILPIASELVSSSGRLALLIGEGQMTKAKSILSTFTWNEPLRVPLSQNRVLAVAHAQPSS